MSLLGQLPVYEPGDADRVSRELRRDGYPPDLVSAALTQQKLRARAVAKFGSSAQEMLFTEAGVQQATRALVADLHARRYVEAGCRTVADITCGIGADSLALTRAGLSVIACDLDATTVACARYNLGLVRGEDSFSASDVGTERSGPGATAGFMGVPGVAADLTMPFVRVLNGDGLSLDFSQVDGVFADPGRRRASGRTFNPADYSPPLDRVLALRREVGALGVKVAPGIAYADLPEDAHGQWVSVDGDVVEAGVWFGPLASGPGRSALVIRGCEINVVDATDDPRSAVIPMEPADLGRYLYSPDGAVIRAGALHILAEQLQAAPVSERIAYLTGNLLIDTPLATAFEVVEAMPLKKLRGYLRDHRIGSLEILKRGVDVVPDQFRKGLALAGGGAATVVLTRLRGRHSAVIARRV